MFIFTKFQEYQTRIVDFLLMVNFWVGLVFFNLKTSLTTREKVNSFQDLKNWNMVGAQSYKYSGGSNAAEKLCQVLNFAQAQGLSD